MQIGIGSCAGSQQTGLTHLFPDVVAGRAKQGHENGHSTTLNDNASML